MPRQMVVNLLARQVFVAIQSSHQNRVMMLNVLGDEIETPVGNHQLLPEPLIDLEVHGLERLGPAG
jgi:hypothetical protein